MHRTAGARKEAREETLQLSLPRQALRQVGSGYWAHSWACHLPAQGGRERHGCGCPGSWRTGRAVAVLAGLGAVSLFALR